MATKKARGAGAKAVKTAKTTVPSKKSPKKAPAKKSAPKKKPGKKAPAKKAPAGAKKTAAKKAAARSPKRAVEPKPRPVATAKTPIRAKRPGSSHPSGPAAVDGYVARLESWQREVIEAVRRIIRRTVPNAAETIKWGQPVFEAHGPFAYVRPAGSHVTFGFWRGAELDDRRAVLEGSGDRMRHLKIHDAGEIDDATVEAFVRQAVELNRVHGNPATVRR